jgi:hypothetical protein
MTVTDSGKVIAFEKRVKVDYDPRAAGRADNTKTGNVDASENR